MTIDRFAAALQSSLAYGDRRSDVGDQAERPAEVVERYLASLHLEDLALAVACGDGNESAWEHFVRQHRPALYRAANAIDSTGSARELADSLYGELFGLTEHEGERRSLFRYFHGRSSLATWLRTVLSQRYVDQIRRSRRLDPLPADEAASLVSTPEPMSAERARFLASMQRALTAAIGRLPPRDRLRLACYYAQELSMAQIGRTLGEHEATCSRHLARTRRAIREDVEYQLRNEGMSEAELRECFSSVVGDAGPLTLAEMLEGDRARKKSDSDRSP